MTSALRPINPAGLPKLTGVLSHAVVVESTGMVHTSGQLSWDASGALVDGTMGEQLRCAYANIDTVLREAGTSRAQVVSETIYIVGYTPALADELVAALVAARPEGATAPASTVVGVQSLFAPGFLVEIQVTAVAGLLPVVDAGT